MQGVGSGTLVRRFRAGDTVFHRPTGETWLLIKDEHDGWVTPGGWPASQGRAEDCKLVEPIENCRRGLRASSPNTEYQTPSLISKPAKR